MFTIGTDSEVAIHDKKTYRSIIGIINGSKHNPVLTPFGNIQEDNVFAEFAINPVDNEREWVKLITDAKKHLEQLLNPLGFDIHINSCIELPDFELANPEVWEFGCEPDYNAYSGRQNPRPENPGNRRVAGGHIHVGHTGALKDRSKRWLIKYMDLYLGLPSVILDNTPESRERRLFYGKAGSFRPKPYGVEYRTLSNFWIQDESLMKWAFQQTTKAVAAFEKKPMYEEVDLRPIINAGDVHRAYELVKEYNVCKL